MKIFKLVYPLAAAVLVIFSAGCSGSLFAPSASSINVSQNEISLETGGSASIQFTVEDKDYRFNYDLGAIECQLHLWHSDFSESKEFRLSEVQALGGGNYVATVQDLGGDYAYSEDCRLSIQTQGIQTGKPEYIHSQYFTIKAEKVAPELLTGLPVVYVNTQDYRDITSKVDDVKATISVKGAGEFGDTEELPCTVRGRGNTTWNWSKKPYLVKMESKTSFFGMPKHKRWVLLANFMDKTLMRNMVAYKASMLTSLSWTPHFQNVELVLNGKHLGTYMFIEQVRVDKNRVNVSEEGGYLLESDFHYDNEIQWTVPYGQSLNWSDQMPFAIKFPDEDDITVQQEQWIKDYIDSAMKALYGPDFKDPQKGWRAYMDEKSYIDYWLVYELMNNMELGNPGSVYTHKDKDGLLVAGPVWDFDWGSLSFYRYPKAKDELVLTNSVWYKRLLQDENFCKALVARWRELKPSFETLLPYIDEQKALLARSARINFGLWDPSEDARSNNGDIINGDENMSFDDAVALLRESLQRRIQVIDANIGSLAQ